MHFGASKRQVSLYTGIVYTKQSTVPFCSVPYSLKHGPAAIWAHLEPVVSKLRNPLLREFTSSVMAQLHSIGKSRISTCGLKRWRNMVST